MLIISVIVAGFAVVLLTSLIKNTAWDSKYKNLLATVLSVVAAGLLFISGIDFTAITAIDILGLITSVYGTSQLIYNFIFTGTPLEGVEYRLANIGSPETPVNEG